MSLPGAPMARMNAVLLFPPNWSACVNGPHLALPLLAGMARGTEWSVEVRDLSEEFYRISARPPCPAALRKAVQKGNFGALDQLYFTWEDQFQSLSRTAAGIDSLGLLSGYSFSEFQSLPLHEASRAAMEGTIYTRFLTERVLPSVLGTQPSVIAITIASQNQMIPALELLQLIRKELPDTFLLLGGNIVTRLRESPAFAVLTSLADQTVVFQGDLAFLRVLQAVGDSGVRKARQTLPRVVSDESVPCDSWPVPAFDGIAFEHTAGTPVLPYVSTRGCYWGKCHFCAIPAGWSSTGYGGSAPASFVAKQIVQMATETGIPRVKFVDEAIPPGKVRSLSRLLRGSDIRIEWEAYARLEPAWEENALLEEARAGGLYKLYFGLEQAPSATRRLLGKNDRGDPLSIIRACYRAGIRVHLFCMVGYPGTSREDAKATVQFLLDNESMVDTADLVGFRLDRGTQVPGVRPVPSHGSDWTMSLHYEPAEEGVFWPEEVAELEATCQEQLWETVPRLLHPLYRIVGHWETAQVPQAPATRSKVRHKCLPSFSSTL